MTCKPPSLGPSPMAPCRFEMADGLKQRFGEDVLRRVDKDGQVGSGFGV